MNDAKPELQGPNRLTWNVDIIYDIFHRVRWFLYFEYTRVLKKRTLYIYTNDKNYFLSPRAGLITKVFQDFQE